MGGVGRALLKGLSHPNLFVRALSWFFVLWMSATTVYALALVFVESPFAVIALAVGIFLVFGKIWWDSTEQQDRRFVRRFKRERERRMR